MQRPPARAPPRRACWSSATRASRARCWRPPWPPAWRPRAARRCSAASCPLRARRCSSTATGSTSGSSSRRRTTRTPTTASSSSARTASSSPTPPSSRSRRRWRSRPPARPRSAACGRSTARWRTTCARSTSASPASTSAAAGSRSTAPTAPPTRPGRRSSAAWAPTSTSSPTSPTAATSTRAAAPRTSTRSPPTCARAATTPASPSTATATACWPSTARGAIVDGDELIALAALHLRGAGRLKGDGVAVTVMTNYGFHTAMGEAGVEVATTPVGDRYVLEALRERGWALGGEQSGHIIDMGFVPSGDGIAAALLTLESLEGGDLADRARDGEAPAAARSTSGSPTARRSRPPWRPRRTRSRRSTRRSPAAGACSCARAAPSRSSA